jgi:RHS repeat-associated protein
VVQTGFWVVDQGTHTVGTNVTAPAGCRWTAKIVQGDFISMDGGGGSGSGSGSIQINVMNNPDSHPRVGFANIAGTVVAVSQASETGSYCSWAISAGNTGFERDGGSGTITVTPNDNSGCPWTAFSKDDWIWLSNQGINGGPGSVGYAVAPYYGSGHRDGYISINNQNNNNDIHIQQNGDTCPAPSVGTATFHTDASGDTFTSSVTEDNGCGWEAVNLNPSFLELEVSSSNPSGPGWVRIRVLNNTHPFTRIGKVVVRKHGIDPEREIVITQDGSETADPAGAISYYHTDPLGSVRLITNEAGAAVSWFDYTPFGTRFGTSGSDSTGNRVLFTGKERDFGTETTGLADPLIYFGARHYQSQTGRFTTTDPFLDQEQALSDPRFWNRYTYVLNNPLKLTDPDGRNPLLIGGGIGAAVFAGWKAYVNVQQGLPWYDGIGLEASKGFLVGATLGLAAPAVGLTTEASGLVTSAGGAAAAPVAGSLTLTAASKAAFLDAAVAAGRAGVSAAGSALQSHATRAGSWLAGLSKGGSAAANTAAARKVLAEVLQDGTATRYVHKVWGEVIEVRLADGRGAVWLADGTFKTFLEAYTPK